jgi:2-polyprenyl-3-methyl-5-hydroxy-6-metoxy-1,4-benzoquinol methylase
MSSSDDDAASRLFDETVQGAELTALLSRIPSCRADYASAEWWRRRYAAESAAERTPCESFTSQEWYSAGLDHLLVAVADAGCQLCGAAVLQLGCGFSALGPRLVNDAHVAVCVESDVDPLLMVKLRHSSPDSRLAYVALDATRLALRSNSFDVVVEKGTFDALQCAGRLCRDAAREALRISPILLCVTANADKLRATLSGFNVTHCTQVHQSECYLLVVRR